MIILQFDGWRALMWGLVGLQVAVIALGALTLITIFYMGAVRLMTRDIAALRSEIQRARAAKREMERGA